jgi:hypothetical protein
MLKTCLCAGVQFVPDVDLAIRRRIINGLKTHPLRQQFTVSGPEPARLWLGRYHKADEAGLVFERQAGFNCGLTLDDVGHISVGMDAIHECLLDLFSLVLMQANIGTVLPECSREVFCLSRRFSSPTDGYQTAPGRNSSRFSPRPSSCMTTLSTRKLGHSHGHLPSPRTSHRLTPLTPAETGRRTRSANTAKALTTQVTALARSEPRPRSADST